MENKNIKDFKIHKLCTLRDTRRRKKCREDFRNSGTKVLINEQLEQASECLGIGTQQYLKKNGWNFPKFGKIVNEE